MPEYLPITRTKILVPRRRADLLSRTRLLDLLDELLENRLIIIAAPAGYGKTSLLVDFAHSSPWPVCWYALDALDQDPYRFVAHFIAAIAQRFPGFGKSCLAALQGMGQENLNLDVLVSLIINDAYDNITEHFLLVLDDFHLVESNESVVYFVNRFIQDADENCHMALASRVLLTLPDLPLMVARSQVGGLSFDELIFQSEEIQRLLQQNYALNLSDQEAAELARETEGWVTGLLLSTQLMGKTIANRLRVARVSGVGLYEYLAQQVLAQQSEEVQSFLLRTALLDEFDETLCQDVIGEALGIQLNWRELMASVTRYNLFILPVGEEGLILRYHHLFLDFLRDRAQRTIPHEARLIQLRLAEFYAARQDWERAYAIYQRMGETQAIVRLVEQAGSIMVAHGRLLTLAEWLESLPPDLLPRHPSLISLQGVVAGGRGDTARSLQFLDQAVAALRQNTRSAGPGADESMLQLALALVRRGSACHLLGEFHEALQDVDEALALVGSFYDCTSEPAAEDRSAFPNRGEAGIVYADALQSKGIIHFAVGQLQEAMQMLRQALEAYRALEDTSSAAKVWMEIGRLHRALGEFESAEKAYRQSLSAYHATGNLVLQANLYNNLGVLQHQINEYVEATTSLEKAIQYARLGGAPRLEAYALASIGDLYQELDAAQETLEAYRQAREISRNISEGYLLFYLDLAEARLELSRANAGRAQELLLSAQSAAAQRGSPYEQNGCLLETARLAFLQQRPQAALEAASAALQFFQDGEYRGDLPRARLLVLLAGLLAAHPQPKGSPSSNGSGPASAARAALLPLLDDPEGCKLLVAAAREVKPHLQALRIPRADPALAGFFTTLLDLVERQEQSIPNLRRQIRRHALIVPFAPPKMVIRALGRVQLRVSDHVVSSSEWQVQTARDLFMLILAHPEGLTKEQIGETFWPDSTPAELKLRFKNTIYRLRHAAGKDAILFQGESIYLFNRAIDYEYDVESFLKELSLAEKAGDSAARREHYRAAIKFYKGPYLPDVDESWAIIERERLFQAYIDTLLHLAALAFEAKEYAAALEDCQRVLKEDPCQEEAHRLAMRIHAAQGNRHLVVRQYEQCAQALLDELDASPSPQTIDLYELLTE